MNRQISCLENEHFRFEINHTGDNYIYFLFDKLNNTVMADMDFLYTITPVKGKRIDTLQEREIVQEGDRICIRGWFSGCTISFTQIFEIKTDDRWLYEGLTIKNEGNTEVILRDINFGMRKMLFRQYEGWCENLDRYKLMSIPTRRFCSQNVDRRTYEYTAADLIYPKWEASEDAAGTLPGYCDEGWIWSGDKGGLLTCKYNVSQIELARVSRQGLQLPGRGCENVAVVYGGTSVYRGNPELGLIYPPGNVYTFGVTKYTFFTGNFNEGYYIYRDHLDKLGHTFPEDYNPPVHWNELYNLGWFMETIEDGRFTFSDNPDIHVYTLEDLYREARNAKNAGAESLYLDPGWDLYPGSSVWDEKRLGKFKDFADTIHNTYGLKVALHLMMTFASDTEIEAFYCRNADGGKTQGGLSLYSFCPNEVWVKEKTARLLKLVDEGVDFFMFDFPFYGNDKFIGCMDPSHGHEMPMRKQTHADNIMRVIHNVKKHKKDVLIEAHDRIVGGGAPYHTLYFQHGGEYSFDENWGYEYMWNSLSDLLSGKAFSLYEYNMAYSLPLYLHINEHGDNDNLLSLWWYISTTRHLGIGGVTPEEPKFALLRSALTLYHRYKSYFTRGKFYGFAYDTHVHVDRINHSAVVNTFNLSSEVIHKSIMVPHAKYGINAKNISAYDGVGLPVPVECRKTDVCFEITVSVNSLTPVLIVLD